MFTRHARPEAFLAATASLFAEDEARTNLVEGLARGVRSAAAGTADWTPPPALFLGVGADNDRSTLAVLQTIPRIVAFATGAVPPEDATLDAAVDALAQHAPEVPRVVGPPLASGGVARQPVPLATRGKEHASMDIEQLIAARPTERRHLGAWYCDLIDAAEREHVPLRALAERLGVVPETVYAWKRKRAGRSMPDAGRRGTARLIRLRVAEPATPAPDDRPLELRLGRDRSLLIHRGFDREDLVALLGALERC